MHRHSAFGLVIGSALELPELAPATSAQRADVTVRVARVRDMPPGADVADGRVCVAGRHVWLAWPGVATFRVCDGRELVVDPADGVDADVLRLHVLGPPLGVLLHQRGYLVLHASAVAIRGRAVVLAGHSRDGKSTTAAALAARGHALLADDMAALLVDGRGVATAFPGCARLKLEGDAAAATGHRFEAMRPFHPLDSRREWRPPATVESAPVPVSRVCLLDEGDCVSLEDVAPAAAFPELVRHSYALRRLGVAGATGAHLSQCAAVATHTPVQRLRRPMHTGALDEVACLLEAAVGEDVAARP